MKKKKRRCGLLLLAAGFMLLCRPSVDIRAAELRMEGAWEEPASEAPVRAAPSEAAEQPAPELVRYSEIYDTREEVPEPPEIWTDEKGEQWKLTESRLLTVPLTGRKRELRGEVVYPEVMKGAEIPVSAVMEVKDEESGQAFEAALPLERTEYEKERWQADLEFTVTFHSYGADFYRFGEIRIPHRSEEPPLESCKQELLSFIGMAEEDCRIEAFQWSGEAYEAGGILCRDARVTGSRRVWDCRAIYAGETALPDVVRYRRQMRYEPYVAERMPEEASEAAEQMREDLEQELSTERMRQFSRMLLRRILIVSASLLLLFLAVLGFRFLWRAASRLRQDKN